MYNFLSSAVNSFSSQESKSNGNPLQLFKVIRWKMQTNASGNPPAPLPGAVNLRWLSVIHYNVPDDASSYNSDWIQ